jgi:hypothetical protein
MPWPFARVFQREKSALRNRATAEITDGDTVTDTVFDANNSAFFADAAFAKQVTMAQVVEYPDVDVAGLFVLALQLPICFEVRVLSGSLVSSTPE